MPVVSFNLTNSEYDIYYGLRKTLLKEKSNPAKFIFLKGQNDIMREQMRGRGFILAITVNPDE